MKEVRKERDDVRDNFEPSQKHVQQISDMIALLQLKSRVTHVLM